MSNFTFLQPDFPDLYRECLKAEQYAWSEPKICAILCRSALEKGMHILYESDQSLVLPYDTNLGALLFTDEMKALLDRSMFQELNVVRKIGNAAAHSTRKISKNQSFQSVKNIFRFARHLSIYYGDSLDKVPRWDETQLRRETKEQKTIREQARIIAEKEEQLAKEREQLRAFQEELKHSEAQRAAFEEKTRRLTERKEAREREFISEEVNPPLTSERETRLQLIDLLLTEAGWTDRQPGRDVEYPVTGMPESTNRTGTGYVDYVLWGRDGLPLALVEAKSTLHSPRKGKHQATLYADCLEKEFGRRPIVYYSNGWETFLWDDQFYPHRNVSGFHKPEELQLMIDRRKTRKDLRAFDVNPDISNRPYQLEAIKRVADRFVTTQDGQLKGRHRKALLVMATGSGKTRTSISIVDMLTKNNWVKRVLFLADRNALVKQAKNAFKDHLPHLAGIDLTREEDPDARLVFSTYPTILNKIDGTKNEDGRYYGVGHFDLIIIDEAHRSVYQKYRAIFQHFDSLLIGLTATPKNQVDRNTYELFDLEDGVPTFAYELHDAVDQGYLVPAKAIEIPVKLPLEGVRYKDLSEREKREYEEHFGDPGETDFVDNISGSAVNSWLFNKNTIDQVLKYLMEHGIKVKGGDKLGKTIIFAKNHKHAVFIEDRFNACFPEYSSTFLEVIDNYNDKAQSLLDRFVNDQQELDPQIAVSVDMMDTGVDAPRVVNLVFFKKVYSQSKFWQMIGRGTRLRPDLFGPGKDKEFFLIFDLLENFEFFDENPEGYISSEGKSLTEKIFQTKLQLALAIRNYKEVQPKDRNFSEHLIQELHGAISRLNEENINVRQEWEHVRRFKQAEEWQDLNIHDRGILVNQLAKLTTIVDEEEKALRFDFLMYSLMLYFYTNDPLQTRKIDQLTNIAVQLEKKANIPAIGDKLPIIQRVQTDTFWQNADLNALEQVREALRDLMVFLEAERTPYIESDFEDELELKQVREDILPEYKKTVPYRERVEQFIRKNKHHLVIDKLYKNKAITAQEWQQLEDFLYSQEFISKERFEREFEDTTLGRFIRRIVGLDQNVVNELFSSFIQNENLTPNQITFVQKIIDYVQKNGYLDKKLLVSQPFDQMHEKGILGVFEGQDAVIRALSKTIDQVNTGAETA